MNRFSRQWRFIAVFLFLLSCSVTRPDFYELRGTNAAETQTREIEQATEQIQVQTVQYRTQAIGPAKCNRSVDLKAWNEILVLEKNDFGTSNCEFDAIFRNQYGTDGIWIVAMVNEIDSARNSTESEWAVLGKLEPGETVEKSGYYRLVTDPGKTGYVGLTYTWFVGILDSEVCLPMRYDEEFLHQSHWELPDEYSACGFGA
jgi:hypothetical protein